MKKRTRRRKSVVQQYTPRYTDMQWDPNKAAVHIINSPRQPDLVRRMDDFAVAVMRWWGLDKFFRH